jgi:hypothetical protein
MSNQTMYKENIYWPDAFKGCGFDCVYCVPSFQRQAKRQKHRCQLCYEYKPHFHPERLYKRGKFELLEFIKTPATKDGQFIFFPKGGDPCFATERIFREMLAFIDFNSQTTFLVQTKAPLFLLEYEQHQGTLPSNLILGITLEGTEHNYVTFEGAITPSKYKCYDEISKAIDLNSRCKIFAALKHKRKFVTIEPILLFDYEVFVHWLKSFSPEVIYIGYDTKNCKLPEPKLEETLLLIDRLEGEGFEVRQKTIRKAWWE